MDKQEAEKLWDLAFSNPHHHVVCLRADGSTSYGDGHTRVGALDEAAGLIESPDEAVSYVWIAEGAARGCPLAHGDDDADDPDAEGRFLADVMNTAEPFWVAGDGA